MAVLVGTMVGLGCLLVFFSILYLETDAAQMQLQTQINSRIPGEMSWKRLRVSPFSGRIALESFRLNGPDKREVARFERLALDIAWVKLLKGEISVSSLVLESPRVTVQSGKDGSIDLVAAVQTPGEPSEKPEAPSGPFPFNVTVDSLVIKDGQGQYSNPMERMVVSFSGLDIGIRDVDLQAKKAVVQVGLSGGSFVTPDVSTGLDQFKTHAVFNDGSLSALSLDLSGKGLKMAVTGSITDLLGTPVFGMTVDAQATLKEISGMLTHDPKWSGIAQVHLKANGSLDHPKIELKAGFGNGVIQGQVIDRIDLGLALEDRLFKLFPSRVETPLGQVVLNGEMDLAQAFPNGFFHAQKNLNALSYSLFMEQKGTDLSKFLSGENQMGGSVSSRVRLKGKGIDLETLTADLALDVTANGFNIKGLDTPVDIDMTADAGFGNQTAILRSVSVVTPGIHLSGDGKFEPGSGNFAGNIDLVVADLSTTPGLSPLKGTGQVTLSAKLAGPYLSPGIKLDLRSDHLGMQDIFIGNLDMTASMDRQGRVLIDRLALENQGSKISVTGWIDLFVEKFKINKALPRDIRLSFTDVEVSDFSARAGLKGVFNGSTHLTGTMTDPEAAAQVSGKGLVLASSPVGDADVKLRFSNRTVFIESLGLTHNRSLLKARGSATVLKEDFSLMEMPEFTVSLTGDSLFLDDFLEGMAGQVSVNANVQGTPEALSGTVNLTGSRLDLGVQKVDGFSLETVLDGQTITINDMDIRVSPQAVFKGRGWASLADKQLDLGLSTQTFPLMAIDLLKDKALTGGQLSLDLTCTGTIETPVVKSQVNIKGLEIKNKSVPDIDLFVDIKNRIARMKGNLGPVIDGEYHFDDKTFLASVDMNSVDLSPYFIVAGQPDFSGMVKGSIRSSGSLDDLPGIQGIANFETLSLRFRNDEMVRIPGLNLSLEKGKIRLPETRITLLDQGEITLKGEGSLDSDMDLQLKGMLPFQMIRPFVEEIHQASGKILLSAALKGSVAEPQFTADVKLDKLGMSLSVLEQNLKGIDGIIRITPERIEIIDVKGSLDDGTFDLAGQVGLKGFTPDTYDVRFRGQQLALDFPEMMTLSLNSSLSLIGNAARSDLKGEIVLLDGRYYKDIQLDLFSSSPKKRQTQPIQEKQPAGLLETIHLDIDIRHRDPFWVDNNLALLSIGSDLNVFGTAAKPLISGRAQVDSGTLSFQKKEFEVRKGIIDFVNPYKIEPFIDIQGDMEVSSWTVSLSVSGTPDNLDFKLTSIPAEQHADILSLMAFGKPTRELRQSDGGTGFSAGDILAGFVAETLQKNMKDATGMDYLEIKPNSTDNKGNPGVNVVVGKELSRQMMVKYGVDVRDGETVQRVTTDYKILENFLMSGFQDTGGAFGGEIKYRLEFR